MLRYLRGEVLPIALLVLAGQALFLWGPLALCACGFKVAAACLFVLAVACLSTYLHHWGP